MATRNLVSTEWQAPRHTDPLSLLQLPQRLPPRRGPQLRYQGSTCKQFLAFIRPSSLRCSSKVCCRRNFTSQEVQTVQCERRFGGRPATTSKATSGPSSLQRPVPPAKPQGFRKPKVFGPLTLRHKEAGVSKSGCQPISRETREWARGGRRGEGGCQPISALPRTGARERMPAYQSDITSQDVYQTTNATSGIHHC